MEQLNALPRCEYPVTVIIPTYNRASVLIVCLQHLEQQTYKEFEVVVVDDGSTDNTAQLVEEYRNRTPLALTFLRQPNAGPARARNTAIAAARGALIVMIDDDIFSTPRLVEKHLELHRRRPECRVAGLGLTKWDDKTQKVTPFMRFMEEGTQFSYPDLKPGESIARDPHFYFYTSNLSVKTETLRRNRFCERFPGGACLEDLELGYRIKRMEGLELVFLPDALAHHYHPTTFVQSCSRTRKAGWSAHLMYEIWPDLFSHPAGKTPVRRMVRKAISFPPILWAATGVSAAFSNFYSVKTLFRAVLGTYLYLGYKDREAECHPEIPSPISTGRQLNG